MVIRHDKKHFRVKKSVLKPISSVFLIIIIAICVISIYKFKINNRLKTVGNSAKTLYITNTDKPKTTVVNAFNVSTKNLPLDISFQGSIKNNSLIGCKEDYKNIYSYNINDANTNIISKVYNNNNFIKTIISDSEWIIWVENETLVEDTKNKPFKWQMIAQNIQNGKRYVVDKSSFTSNKYNVPMFINYTPDKLAVYNNTLVYCKTVPDGSKIKTELIQYDLSNNSSNIISSTDDVMNGMIADCNIYENKIVWSTYKEINKNYNERLTQYRFSDLYIYDIDSKKVRQLTSNDFYTSPYIFKDKIAAVKIPLKNPDINACNSEIVMIDLNSKKVQIVVDENSPCYSRVEKELYRCSPVLTDKYLLWQNNSFSNTYIYNYNTNKFLNLLKPEDNSIFIDRIYAVYGNYVLMYHNTDEEKNNRDICFLLDTITQ